MSNCHPDCPNMDTPQECRVAWRTVSQTSAPWIPVFDGNGVMTNSDPSTTVREAYCSVCDMRWQTTTTGGETKVTDTTAKAEMSTEEKP